MPNEFRFDAIAVTQPPKHHFFGYYGIDCWNSTGEFLLYLESDVHERPAQKENGAAT